jgi:hypothetical protein
MPFDAAIGDSSVMLFQQRRERAAAYWMSLPKERFNMRRWERQLWPCGYTACALGWLAESKFDGWTWVGGGKIFAHYGSRVPLAPNGIESYIGAATYFGMTYQQTIDCFGGDYQGDQGYDPRTATPADVAKFVLAQPPWIDDMAHLDDSALISMTSV